MRNTANKAPGTPPPGTPPGTATGPGNGTPGSRTPGGNSPGTKRPGMRTFCAATSISLLALSGCNQIDPLQRPYMWHATGINEQNIAAMAVNPNDLVHGRETSQRKAVTESDGVTRLWTGHTLPLLTDTPGASASTSTSSGGGGGSSGGAPPASGGS
jgi:hypothetical protein